MTRERIVHVLLAFAATLCIVSPAAAQPGPLVAPDWLEQQLQSQSVLLLDASMPHEHAAGHIAGAVNASVFGNIGRDLTAADMERRIRAWGVSPGRRIVVYDQGGTWMATRLYFDLYVHGVPPSDLHLLDGGLARWKAAGKPVTKDPTPAPAAGTWRVTRVVDDARVRLPEVLVASGDTDKHVLIDALEPPYFYGGAKFFDRPGHIPNARLWPSSDFFNADKTFKSPEEIRRMAAHLGLKPEQTVHVYCGGGGAAAVPFFALRVLLDRPKVTLYNESLFEWLRDERGLPVWTHAAPAMLRRMAWLDGWNGPMVRMSGLASISVVDLRSPEAYRQGHVPYALNIPADTFRSHLRQPDKLAELLGAAGVNAQHETVLTADGGLTPATALAWWMLERAGQSKVSLLVDSIDDWGLGGLPLAKEPTTVGPRKSPQDLAVPATSYPAPRPQAGAPSAYPKVYLAAGKQAPAQAPAQAQGSRLIHLPYTDLLDAQGQPKAAKDLWSLLAKAGVPRHAELLSFADDPGEAAVNVLVLRLMGFADVKLWMP